MENYTIGECCYDYIDAEGILLFQVIRFYPKRFMQRKLENGKWIYKLNGVRRVLYRLPEVIEADVVFVVEGEKDVNTLRHALTYVKDDGFKYAVTTCCGGSGAWKEEYNGFFKCKYVIIIPDNDEPGMKLARNVASGIFSIAKAVKIIKLPYPDNAKDISDWLSQGSTVKELFEICDSIHSLTEEDIKQFNVKPQKKTLTCQDHGKGFERKNYRGVDKDMIELATSYPISKIIDVDEKGMAHCVSIDHEDTVRSMDTRRNFMFCYGCGFHGNVIDLARIKWNVSFTSAVHMLCELS